MVSLETMVSKIINNFILIRIALLLSIFICIMPVFALAAATGEKLLEPSVSFVGRGPVVPISKDQSIPISVINLSEIDVDILKSNNPVTFLDQYYFNHEIKSWDLSRIERGFTSVHLERYTLPKAHINEEQSARIRIPSSMKPGWYLVVIRRTGSYDNLQVRHVLLTDIGIQAKVFNDSITVRAASLSSGYVLNSGVVKLYRKDGKLFESAAIGTDGKATLDVRADNNDIIVVESGKSTSILPLREIPLDLSEFTIGGRVAQPENVFVYSNRDLIRPGESLPINILLRDTQGERLANIPLTLTLLDSKNKQLFTHLIEANQNGYYRYDIESQSFWNVGRYTLEVRTDSTAKSPNSVFRFQVEEFTPERMELVVTPKQENVHAGDIVQYDLEGRYLFGAPANNNLLKSSVTYQPVNAFTGKYKDFYVGKKHSLNERYKKLNEVRLSERGTTTLTVATPLDNQIESPVKVETEFSLLELGGTTVQRKHAVVVWKKSAIPAVRPHDKTFAYRSQAAFDVALLSADGSQAIAGDVQIKVDFDQGNYYWIYEEGRGWLKKTQDKWRTIVEKRIFMRQGETSLLEVPVTWGNYRLMVIDSKSKNITEYEFYAGWSESRQQMQAKPDHLAISLDKTHYRAGDVITATVEAPVKGDLTLTVESNKELFSTTVRVEKGKHKIEMPVEAQWNSHDIYISSVLTANINGQPIRYMGVTPLKLDRTDRRLMVDVMLSDVIKADKEMTIPVKVTGGSSDKQKTWVTLSLVDRGILNLSQFKPQNPYQYFYDQQRYAVDVIDLYSRLYDLRPDPFAASRFGSDSMSETAMAEMMKNKNESLVEVKTLTLMSKPVEVVDSIANVLVKIPDYNGEVQIIATAFNDNEFGQFVADNKVASEVIAELSIPKFFVPGDKSAVSVELFNVSGEEQKLEVTLRANNSAIHFDQPLDQSVLLKDKQRFNVQLPLSVADNYQHRTTQIMLSVKGSSGSEAISIEREWSVPIRPSVPLFTKTLTATIQPEQSMEIPNSLWKGLNWIQENSGTLTVSYGPQIDIQRQVNDLFSYPYGCSEQTVSKAMPYLYSLPQIELAKQKQLQRAKQSEEEVLSYAVQQLLKRQLSHGAFSLWDEGSEDDWVTVYVSDFLTQVYKKYPQIVPKPALDNALSRVKRYVTRRFSNRSQVNTFAYAAYVLAKAGMLNWSELNKVWQSQNSLFKESKLAYVQLAAAFALVGDSAQAENMLNGWKDVEWSVSNQTSPQPIRYGSSLRDSALASVIIDDLISQRKINKRYSELRNNLMVDAVNASYKSRWLSTQDNNALLQAAVLSARGKTQSLSLEIDGQEQNAIGHYFGNATPSTVVKNVNREPVMLYVNAQGYPEPSVLESGYVENTANTITKVLTYLDGREYQGEPLKVGERLVVDIVVGLKRDLVNLKRERIYLMDVLVEDFTPAGFALENPMLNQGPSVDQVLADSLKSRPLTRTNHQEFRNDRYVAAVDRIAGFNDQVYRFAYVIRAETPGQYAVPATKIEAMYNPSHRIVIKANTAKVVIADNAKMGK